MLQGPRYSVLFKVSGACQKDSDRLALIAFKHNFLDFERDFYFVTPFVHFKPFFFLSEEKKKRTSFFLL